MEFVFLELLVSNSLSSKFVLLSIPLDARMMGL